MMKLLVFKALQVALCTFFNFCLDQDECPDGVCDNALAALDGINDVAPPLTVTPGKVQAFDFGSIDWTKLQAVSDAVVELITALKAFFGMNRVG